MEKTYKEIMDELLAIRKEKKRKNPSKLEQKQYNDSWIALVTDEGYTDTAERYLFNGFYYCGATPFEHYLIKCNDPFSAIKELYSGKLYHSDFRTRFCLLTHLLALLLNDNAPLELAVPIMKRLPKASLNKENKIFGTAAKTFEKYFFSVLNTKTDLPSLNTLNANPNVIDTFVEFIIAMTDMVCDEKFDRGIAALNVPRVRKWAMQYKEDKLDHLQENLNPKEESNSHNGEDVPNVLDEQENSTKNSSSPSVEPSVNNDSEITNLRENSNEDYVLALLAQASATVEKIKKTESDQELQRKRSDALLEEKNLQIAALQDDLECLQRHSDEQRKKISDLEADIVILKQEIEKSNDQLCQKENELAERIKVADILSRDRTRQASEALQKLASKIRIEYKDYLDAEGIPMTCDLGENMRLQLQNVFDILEKGGMKIK